MLKTKPFSIAVLAGGALLLAGRAASAGPINEAFNGHADNQTSQYGFYYQVNGGLFPTGTTPNGSNSSGGTMRFITDDPGQASTYGVPLDTWIKDSYPAQVSSVALTLKTQGVVVYDNNGIDTGTVPTINGTPFYQSVPGSSVNYAMSNNFDLIYAGYFKLTQRTVVNQMEGFFSADGAVGSPILFNSPAVGLRMNIWSNVAGDLLPTNTGSFVGDVFSTDTTAGAWSVTATGLNQLLPTPDNTSTVEVPIYRLTYTLNSPLVLEAGTYWFSNDATIPVPEPTSAVLLGLGLVSLIGVRWRHRLRPAA